MAMMAMEAMEAWGGMCRLQPSCQIPQNPSCAWDNVSHTLEKLP